LCFPFSLSDVDCSWCVSLFFSSLYFLCCLASLLFFVIRAAKIIAMKPHSIRQRLLILPMTGKFFYFCPLSQSVKNIKMCFSFSLQTLSISILINGSWSTLIALHCGKCEKDYLMNPLTQSTVSQHTIWISFVRQQRKRF